MREAIMAVYRSEKWAAKVKAMTDQQVKAIFFRLREQGRVTL